jgi:hypothetical protein
MQNVDTIVLLPQWEVSILHFAHAVAVRNMGRRDDKSDGKSKIVDLND